MHKVALTVTAILILMLGWIPDARADKPAPELPPARADVEPDRFRLRTGSVEIGAGWRPNIGDERGVCGFNPLCGVTPRIGFDVELGRRVARLLVGTFTAPIPVFSGDVASLEAFMLELGVLFGGPRVRGGIVANGGAVNGGAAAVLRLSPWVGRRGHRHGLDLRVSTSIFQPFGIAIAYRLYPRKLDRKYPKPDR